MSLPSDVITVTVKQLAQTLCTAREDGAHYDYDYAPCMECWELAQKIAERVPA